jgi:glutathione reductase (NADPH)
VDTLDLDAANIKHDGLWIETDPYLRSTTNPAVWVTGDALTTSPQLLPMATHEGRIVGRNIVDGPSLSPDCAVIPSVVPTVPALVTLGLTEEAAIAKGLDVKVSTSDMTGWFSAKSYAESVARAKVLVDQDTDRIVRPI